MLGYYRKCLNGLLGFFIIFILFSYLGLPLMGTSISIGQTVSGSLAVGEEDNYTFSSGAGNRVIIRMTQTSDTFLSPQLHLYSPDGTELNSSWHGWSAEIISDPLPTTGTYTILASDFFGDDSGEYNLTLERLNPGSGPSISFGQTVSGNLVVGDLDTYTFSATAGNRVIIRMSQTSDTFLSPQLRLYSPDGTELNSSWHGWSAEIISDLLPTTGTYTILASDFLGDDPGEYNLTLERLNPGSGPSISFGQTVSGNLVVGGLDTYTFSATAGNRVIIRMSQTSDIFLTPQIRLYSPDGTELNSSWHGWSAEIISDPLPTTGTYTILASDFLGDDPGEYDLTLERLGATFELIQQVDKFFVWHGAELTYTTTYRNNGDADASNVVIEITLPSTLELINGSISNGGTYNSANRRISWNVGSLPAGSEAQTVTFKAKVASGIADGTKIILTAQISSAEEPEPITASVTTTVALPKITSISPNKGGNVGSVRVTINGQYLDPHAAVKLSKTGKTDIIASNVTGTSDGKQLSATFDLTGKTPGLWNLVVINPGGGSGSLSNSFTIETGGAPKLWVEIIGQQNFRVGRKSTLYVSYGNSGSVCGPSSAIWITLSAHCTIQVDLPCADPSSDYSKSFESDGNELFVLVGSLYPNEYGNFTFTIIPNQEGIDQITARMVVTDTSESNSKEKIANTISISGTDINNLERTWYSPEDWPPPEGSMVFRLSKGIAGAPGHVAIYIGNGEAIELERKGAEYIIKTINIHEEWLGDNSEIDKGKYLGAWDPPGMYPEKRNEIRTNALERLGETGKYWLIPFSNFKNCILFVKEEYKEVGLNTKWWNPLIGPAEIYEGASHMKWPGGLTAYDVIFSGLLGPAYWLSKLSLIIHQVRFSMSWDPNDKVGPTGSGAQSTTSEQRKRFIARDLSLCYMIQFENLETATAAVQDMKISDQLDSNLDWSTFAFDDIQIGTHSISVPQGSQSFSTSVDFRPEITAIVEVECTFNSSTGKAQWIFRGKHPFTGQLADFLPPNTENVDPKGRGWVLYSVKPKANLSTGTVIKNKATIDFEIDVPPAPMDTPEWINTIDITQPESHVLALSPIQSSAVFTVQWQGTDQHSGIRSYSIYVSDNSSSYVEWLSNTTETSAAFTGSYGHTYGFYSIASDNVGNQENAPSAPDTTTTVSGSSEVIININRTALNFGAASGSIVSPSQMVLISSAGQGILNWTATSNQNWLQVSPSSGTGDSMMTVSVDASGLSQGTYDGVITVTDPNASNSPQTIDVTLNVYKSGITSKPFGEFATPIDHSTVRSSIPVTGWVLDDIGVESVKIYRKEGTSLVYIGDAVFVEGARPDVEQAFPDYPFNYKAGWGYMMLTNFLPNGGNGNFKIHAIAEDTEGYEVTLGIKTIICDNANAVKPFGAIDTPTQGGTASGSSFVNWGWVLTPQPNSIPTDGSTINVIVDGVNLGNPTYNIYRSDIADLFPDYANSSGAVGNFYLDTTTYENGVHTIAWTAEDDAGNTDGIGSRYFSIQNLAERTAHSTERAAVFNVQRSVFNVNPDRISVDYIHPVKIKKGCNPNVEPVKVYPNDKGIIPIEIKELERVEIHFFDSTMNIEPRTLNISSLPIGSTLDSERGIFYWQPGPGFIGEYRFVFIEKGDSGQVTKKLVNVVIRSKH